ncbi:hypothetical protein SAY86_012213 [Trapa natans]|uniref:RING-type domain-containing protein n=1 Tax=Trapa natans TaxID=22666 RepID=A0AAN7LZI8_TRANT|nr:hypothetical protein SAY86_012213 [Trapa natans]
MVYVARYLPPTWSGAYCEWHYLETLVYYCLEMIRDLGFSITVLGGWLSDGISRNNDSDIKCETAYATEDGSSLDSYSFRRRTCPKSPFSEGTFVHGRTPPSEQSFSRNVSMDANLEQVSKESSTISVPSCQVYMQPSCSNLSWQTQRFPKDGGKQGSDGTIPGLMSPSVHLTTEEKSVLPSWCDGSTGGSCSGSSDSCSVNASSGLVPFSNGKNWPFDGDSFHGKLSKSSSKVSAYTSSDRQTCGICSKLLSIQKIFVNNELSVVAILVCGHTYHADCLECTTPEFDKYDPSCPICIFGEKQAVKMPEKVLKAEFKMMLKKDKRWRNRISDTELDINYASLGHRQGGGFEEKGLRLGSSSSTRPSSSKSFLRRHFSYGSKGCRPLSENRSTRKGFFWSKTTKE